MSKKLTGIPYVNILQIILQTNCNKVILNEYFDKIFDSYLLQYKDYELKRHLIQIIENENLGDWIINIKNKLIELVENSINDENTKKKKINCIEITKFYEDTLKQLLLFNTLGRWYFSWIQQQGKSQYEIFRGGEDPSLPFLRDVSGLFYEQDIYHYDFEKRYNFLLAKRNDPIYDIDGNRIKYSSAGGKPTRKRRLARRNRSKKGFLVKRVNNKYKSR